MLLKVLSEIAKHPMFNIDRLSETLDVDKPFLHHLLHVLVLKGYLKRQKVSETSARCSHQSCPLKEKCQLKLPSKRKNQETQPIVYSLTTTGKMILDKRK